MPSTDPARVRLNKTTHKLLERLAPGVFLASAAYSEKKPFLDQEFRHSFPVLLGGTLLNIKTPDTFNDTQVHVALAEEWDPKFPSPNSSAEAINVVLSFRGTEPWQACDWLQDLNYIKREITWWHPGGPIPEAHDGFLFSLESCTEYKGYAADGTPIEYDPFNQNDIKDRTLYWAIEEVIKNYNESKTPNLSLADLTRIVVVGHSLGGAIATIASVWARVKLKQYLKALDGKPVTCITTGCPRVGNQAFAEAYSKLMKQKAKRFESFRIVNNRDVVPGVPLNSWEFCHVGTPIWLFRKRSNWAYLQYTMLDELPLVNGKNEVTVRPYGLALSGPDHFQWHYNAAFAQAEATTMVLKREEYEKMQSKYMKLIAAFVEQPVALLLSCIFNVLGVFVVTLGKSFLVNAARHRTRIPAPLYRFLVNMLFIFFTAPLWVFTHVVYWLES